ncbi:MAG: hypothetical protein K2O91_14690 [Lachnospiraceae bacterium]|nr:hypothetical protein [Lachnospiraceae bacterium]
MKAVNYRTHITNKATEGGQASMFSGRLENQGICLQNNLKLEVFMQIYSLQELLKQYVEWGFGFDSLRIATQIPEYELRQLCSDENYRLRDKDKEKYLIVFLLQICCEKPDNDGYYRAMLENLTQYFKIPPEAIASYIGVDVDGLLAFESSSDKDRIEKCIAHLFTL